MARARRERRVGPEQAFFRISEIAEAIGQPHETVRGWLEKAGLLEEVAPGVRMVSREALACEMPRVWNELCRRYEERQKVG